ncbi:MAG: ABC transporter ATP-binding protein [Actinomycetes bacterium]
MTPSSAGLAVDAVTKSFTPGAPVLDGVSMTVAPGSTTALLGPSGCGKTTLLRLLSGLERPESGTVAVGERVLTSSSVFVPPEERRIGMVFQDWALFPHLDVARNVGFGLPRPERRESPRIDAALAMVGLDGLGHRMPDTLSGGQQQRVALARALAPEPAVLLLDEPFSNLDASLRQQVRTDVHRLLVSLGVTTVFVTHDQEEAFVLGDQVVVLHDGRVAQAGPPDAVYRRPADRWVAKFVGRANFLPGTAAGGRATTALGTVDLLDTDLPDSRQALPEGAVEVLVRPEHLLLSPAGPDGNGTVELVEFLGHATSYVVQLEHGPVRVRDAALPRVDRGARVDVSLAPVATVAFPN